MQFNQPFDARNVEPSIVAQPLPPGEYKVVVVASEPKETADKTGGFLELTLRIIDGQFLNKEIAYRLNLYNASQKAVEIAYRQLSAICHVTGVYQIQNSQQLHNIPFVAVIGMQKDNPIYNDVKGVKDINGNAPGKQGQATAAAPAAAPATNGWQQPAAAAAPAAGSPPWGTPAPAPNAPPWGAPSAVPAASPAPAWQPPNNGANAAPAAAPSNTPPWSQPQPWQK